MESRYQFSKAGRSPARGPLVSHGLWKTGLGLVVLLTAIQLPARERDKDALQWGAGLIVNVPFSESEVTQVVQDVIQDGIIRGTKEYNKDEYVMGATSVSTTKVFSEKVESGKVFYKVRLKALDPRNFRDSGDSGTLAVRYIVQPQGPDHVVLRIDARFVEDFRRILHPSNGSVESAEYKDIHDRLDAIALMKSETAEAEREKEAAREKMAAAKQEAAAQAPAGAATVVEVTPTPSVPVPAVTSAASVAESTGSSSMTSSGSTPAAPVATPVSESSSMSSPSPSASADDSSQTLEEHVKDLRRQVQRKVKSPGAPLKSAPFHTASTLQSLAPGTEVLIVVSSPYWYGVETHEGQHGWMLRDDLELLP